jgi:hypothetical protein
VPDAAPIVLPFGGGGSFGYTVELTNHTDAALSAEGWIDAILPDGSEYGPVVGPLPLNLPAGAGFTGSYTQDVAPLAPPGEYWYRARVGDFSTMEIMDESRFGFVVE